METYVEYDICVNKKTYHVTVSEEHNSRGVLVIVSTKHDNHISWALGNAMCNPSDEFNLDYGVRLCVDRALPYVEKYKREVWHGFRRAQWHKLHDVTDEQMMITHWMPIENVTKQDNDGWISVEERLPEALGDIYRASIDVEAKDKDGAIYPRARCVVNKNYHWYGSWSIGNEDGTSGKSIFYITHWRPMRGDK